MLPRKSLLSYAIINDRVRAATSTHMIQRHSLAWNPVSAVARGHPSVPSTRAGIFHNAS